MDDATRARIAANKAAALEKLAEKKRKAEERKRKAAEAAEPQCEPQWTDEPLMEDDCRLGFGKHAEKTASWVYENEEDYARWVYSIVEEYWSQNMKNFAEYVEERENARMASYRGTPHPYEGKRRSWMGGTADRTKKRTRRSGSEVSDDEDEDDARATKEQDSGSRVFLIQDRTTATRRTSPNRTAATRNTMNTTMTSTMKNPRSPVCTRGTTVTTDSTTSDWRGLRGRRSG
jgi:hypothetical protein